MKVAEALVKRQTSKKVPVDQSNCYKYLKTEKRTVLFFNSTYQKN